MAQLSPKSRANMPQKDFAAPGKSFPDSDPEHARLAIGGATRAKNAGNISAGQAASIKSKARAKLGEPSGKSSGKSSSDCAHGPSATCSNCM
jgi:hypothetical protein